MSTAVQALGQGYSDMSGSEECSVRLWKHSENQRNVVYGEYKKAKQAQHNNV